MSYVLNNINNMAEEFSRERNEEEATEETRILKKWAQSATPSREPARNTVSDNNFYSWYVGCIPNILYCTYVCTCCTLFRSSVCCQPQRRKRLHNSEMSENLTTSSIKKFQVVLRISFAWIYMCVRDIS